MVIRHRTDQAVIHVDVIGWGSAVHTVLISNEVQSIAVNAANKSHERTLDKAYQPFINMRAQLVWRMREALDPSTPTPIDLPADPALRADLAAYRWKRVPAGIQIEGKEDMRRRLGRSPDRGDAVCMALISTLKRPTKNEMLRRMAEEEPDRYAELR